MKNRPRPLGGKPANKKVLIILENQEFVRDPRVKIAGTTLREDGWEIHVVCPSYIEPGQPRTGKPAWLDISLENIYVHSYPVRLGRGGNSSIFGEYARSLFHILRIAWPLAIKEKFAVIHICNPPDLAFLFRLPFRPFGAQVIFDQHDLFPEMVLIRFRGPLRWLLHRLSLWLERRTYRASDLIITTNESYKRLAMRRGGKDASDVYVVRNGPKIREFVPEEPDLRLKNGRPFMACYAGVMNEEDGVFELVDVLNYLIKDFGRKDIMFYLLGGGGQRERVARKIEDLKLADQIKMPGPIFDRKEFRTYLSTADVLLAPELPNPMNDKSTFIKVAEYMAIGRPIVAYELTETRFTAGEAALYATPGDPRSYAQAILTLLGDPALAARMGALGRERIAQSFSWEHQARILRVAYERAWGAWRSD